MKKIALFIDGTWNHAVNASPDNTNVYELYRSTKKSKDQVKKYLKGVGTNGSWVKRKFSGGTGLGSARLIREAYEFLSQNYLPGDHIFLFGFSRGAFAARSLSGFADAVGLLLKDHCNNGKVEEAYQLYQKGKTTKNTNLEGYLQKITGFDNPDGEAEAALPIYFIGVWDTVAAQGLPGRLSQFSAPFTEYHQTKLPENVSHARHALALHELRKTFEPLLWTGTHPDNQSQTLRQVWFPGAHGDVGGGYSSKGGLAKLALNWMASEAEILGLSLENSPQEQSSVSELFVHHEIRGLFKYSKPTPRKVFGKKSPQLEKMRRLYSKIRVWLRLSKSPHRVELWNNGLAPQTMDSFYFHDSTLNHLFRSDRRDYLFNKRINTRLDWVDGAALRLFLDLNRNQNRKAVTGLSYTPEISSQYGPSPAQDWLAKINPDELPDWHDVIKGCCEYQENNMSEETLYQSLYIGLAFDHERAINTLDTAIANSWKRFRSKPGVTDEQCLHLYGCINDIQSAAERCNEERSQQNRHGLRNLSRELACLLSCSAYTPASTWSTKVSPL